MITSAALVMVCVFSIFAVLSFMIFKQIGVGLAAAILIDATIVRAVLLPATMKLLGDWNWYLPKWLEWLPHLEPNGDVETVEAPAGSDGVVVTEAASHPLGERAHSEVWARIAGERVLAIGALALVGLHVIDDSFLQPRAGHRRRQTTSSAAWCRWHCSPAPRSCTAALEPECGRRSHSCSASSAS